MRNILVFLFLATLTVSCGSNNKNESTDDAKEINVDEIKSNSTTHSSIVGKYTIFEFEGEKMADRDFGNKTPMMVFDGEKSNYSTSIGCNQIGGKYEIDDSKIKFLPGMSTMMACPDDLESRYSKALSEVDNYKVENFLLKIYKGDELKIVFQPLKR
jgi:heat shock protein HslJ